MDGPIAASAEKRDGGGGREGGRKLLGGTGTVVGETHRLVNPGGEGSISRSITRTRVAAKGVPDGCVAPGAENV